MMNSLILAGQEFTDVDQAMIECRRNCKIPRGIIYKQKVNLTYTHLEVFPGYWIHKKYELYLRNFMEWQLKGDFNDMQAQLILDFVKGLHNSGVPHCDWSFNIKPLVKPQAMIIKVYTRESNPEYFDSMLKLKNQMRKHSEWNIAGFNKDVLKMLKKEHGDKLVINTKSKVVNDHLALLGIKSRLDDNLNWRNNPTILTLKEDKIVQEAIDCIYNWDDCIVLKG